MNTSLVFTFIGADRPGLVECVAEAIAQHGGSWQESRMIELAGQFAGIARVQLPQQQVPTLRTALEALAQQGLQVSFAADEAAADSRPARQSAFLKLIGNDRPGIVRDVSAALAAHGLSIDEFTTEVRDAAMAGGRLFEASALAHAAPSTDLAAVRDDLERLAAELQVEITVADR